MDWNKFARDVHQTAVENGLWDKPRSFDDIVCECLVHLVRAYEEHCNGRPNYYHLCEPSGEKELLCDLDLSGFCSICNGMPCEFRDPKPHGAAAELGECLLRILDYLAIADEDISMEVGNIPETDADLTINVPALVCDCASHLIYAHVNTGSNRAVALNLIMCIKAILGWCDQQNVPTKTILRELHEYNKARSFRHGGKVL